MNLIKTLHVSVSSIGGDPELHRTALMLQHLLKDAGVPDVEIRNRHIDLHKERHDDELKLFVGAKPDKVIIDVNHLPWGG